jgi:hypothetical protein
MGRWLQLGANGVIGSSGQSWHYFKGHVATGYFETEEAAAQAWDLAALKHFGLSWKPKLNMPEVSIPLFLQGPEAAALQSAAVDGGAAAARPYRGVHPVSAGQLLASNCPAGLSASHAAEQGGP